MVNVSIARRYARALLDVASEAGRVDAVAEQLTAFAQSFAKSPELTDVLLNPAYSRSQRIQVVESVMKALPGGTDPILDSTLRLLVDRSRLSYLPDIARLFGDMADARAGRVRGRVTTAAPLQGDALARIQATLQQLTQRNVILETRVDPSLLGGVSAQVGSTLYDGSLRTQLEQMRRELKEH
jgi:F-type H+-transporting ATPase subunit delta